MIKKQLVKIKKLGYVLKPFRLTQPAAVIFVFHTVETKQSPWTHGHRYITPFSAFKKQIAFIKQKFTIESTVCLIDKLKQNAFTANLAAIHFDDGFNSYPELALPFLKKEGIPSTLFLIDSVVHGGIPIRNKIAFCLNTGERKKLLEALQPLIRQENRTKSNVTAMDNRQFLSWIKNHLTKEMEAIVEGIFNSCRNVYAGSSPFLNEKAVRNLKNDSYVEIGSHTLSHPMLVHLTEDEQRKEIFGGHRNLEMLVGKGLQFFAYPHGGTVHFNDTTRRIIEEHPCMVAFSTYGGVNYNFDRTDIKRITLTDHAPLEVKALVLKQSKEYNSSSLLYRG